MVKRSRSHATDARRFLLLPISACLAKLRSRSFARQADIGAEIMRRRKFYSITLNAEIMRQRKFFATTPNAPIMRRLNFFATTP